MTPEIMNPNQMRFNHVLAFEVSKADLLVNALPGGSKLTIKNDRAAILRVMKKEMKRNHKLGIGPLLVVCEATGSYSEPVLACANELGIACHRAHGSRVRAFAKFRGLQAKSDDLDLGVIGDYALSSVDLRLFEPPRREQVELRELVSRRTEVRQMKEADEARLEHLRTKAVIDLVAASIRQLERQLEKLESAIKALIVADQEFHRASELMQSVKGVGPITAASMLAYLPEIGTVSRVTIAALAGLAPYDDRSGTHDGRRHIRGGRAEARCALYMAARSAMTHNEHLRDLADRIQAKGNAYKIVVTAVMRKLVVILNAIVASGKPCQMANAR